MASLQIRNPIQSFIFNFIAVIFILDLSFFPICDARNPIEKFKIRKGLKLSYYNTEADAMDLPTLDAYDFGPTSLTLPPLGQDNALLAPSPFENAPISSPPQTSPSPSPYRSSWISNPPSPNPYGTSDPPSPSPSPYGTSWISGPPTDQPTPAHNDSIAVRPHNGPTQPNPSPHTLRPAGAPVHNLGPDHAMWCVAKHTVPEPVLQRAMDYACGTGADCRSVQPNGPCFVPNTLVAHASYAFNSYWQKTKILGGTCDFGGAAVLITVDPSFRGCHFTYHL